jgi:hypothetical protein
MSAPSPAWAPALLLLASGLAAAEFHLAAFAPTADGVTDGTPALQRCFAITTGPQAEAAVRSMAGGRGIVMDGDVVRGATGGVLIEGDAAVDIGSSPGAEVQRVPGK